MFFSDDLITGAHMAFSVRHVQVGTSFKLAVHGTEENDILLPFSCPFVLQSIGEMAETLVMQLLRVANGNRIAPQTLHAELRELSATPIPRS